MYVRQLGQRTVHVCPSTAGSSEIIMQGRMVSAATKQQKRIVWYHVLK